jgi:hypothetical protein
LPIKCSQLYRPATQPPHPRALHTHAPHPSPSTTSLNPLESKSVWRRYLS